MGNANEGSSMTQIDAARAGTITREMALSLIHIYVTLDPHLFQYKPNERWDQSYQVLFDALYA